MTRTTTRPLLAASTAVAIAAASVLAVAAPASAATVHVPASSIAPDDTAYLGWHVQVGPGTFADAWNGLQVGAGGDSYILNGLVAAGAPGAATTGTALGALITGSMISASGSVQLEVPVSVGATNPPPSGSWATLYSVDSVSNTAPQLTDQWIASRNIGTVVANTPTALGDILDALDVVGDVKYSGFGFWAAAQSPAAVVSSQSFGADTYTFGRSVTPIVASSTVKVANADIRLDESTYTGWHEGYANATPAFSVQNNGLNLGNGADSQIINGLATPLVTVDPFSLLSSAAVNVVSGVVTYQVPVFYGPGSTFTTLRSGPLTAGTSAVALTDLWLSSNAIPATGTTPAIAANTPVVLGDLLEALLAQGGSLQVLAFGVQADAVAPAVVATIVWNGVTYSFLPTLAVTGLSELTVPLAGVAFVLLAGGVLLLARRRGARNES